MKYLISQWIIACFLNGYWCPSWCTPSTTILSCNTNLIWNLGPTFSCSNLLLITLLHQKEYAALSLMKTPFFNSLFLDALESLQEWWRFWSSYDRSGWPTLLNWLGRISFTAEINDGQGNSPLTLISSQSFHINSQRWIITMHTLLVQLTFLYSFYGLHACHFLGFVCMSLLGFASM